MQVEKRELLAMVAFQSCRMLFTQSNIQSDACLNEHGRGVVQVERKELLPMVASSCLAAILLARDKKMKDLLTSAESRHASARP